VSEMAVHIFRRDAVYYWRRRAPRSLANFLDRQHVFLSLRTTSRMVARWLAAQLDLILEDAAMLADSADLHLSRSQIETMLLGVVDTYLTKLERVAHAAKNSPLFDFERAWLGDKRPLWTYALLDAQGATPVVRAEDRARMTADGLSEADIAAVQDHLNMLRVNNLVPTNQLCVPKTRSCNIDGEGRQGQVVRRRRRGAQSRDGEGRPCSEIDESATHYNRRHIA